MPETGTRNHIFIFYYATGPQGSCNLIRAIRENSGSQEGRGGRKADDGEWGMLPGRSGPEAVIWEGKGLVIRKQRRAFVMGSMPSREGRKRKYARNSWNAGLGRRDRGWMLGWFVGVKVR